jgi:hypothetical protein
MLAVTADIGAEAVFVPVDVDELVEGELVEDGPGEDEGTA